MRVVAKKPPAGGGVPGFDVIDPSIGRALDIVGGLSTELSPPPPGAVRARNLSSELF